MITPFQSALLAFLAADREYARVIAGPEPPTEQEGRGAERALAQAGDVLEGELRRMMREESPSGSHWLNDPATRLR